MIKLVVTDMDGTLLDDNHQINEEFWGVLTELKAKDKMFCVASGRQYYNLLERFKGHEEGMIFIAENGSIVMKDGKEIFSKELDKEEAKEFIKIARTIPNVSAVLCGKKSAYIEDSKEIFTDEVAKYYHHFEIVNDLLEVEDDILKVAIYDFGSSETNAYPRYKPFEESHKVVVSGLHWLDIMDKDINKGIALKGIKDYYKLDEKELLIFGDYLNDYEMMSEGYYSYAMKNAHPQLKEVANFEAPDNNENGVTVVIKEFLEKE